MEILNITLHKSYRLELTGIETISLSPKEIVTVIIGSNGSGKSSLMSLLSPLPAEKTDFAKDGYKKITIQHNGVVYTLTNDFKENRHSFYDETNNVELNEGGTVTVQKQLVEDYFQYTPMVHALLTDKEKFTTMSPMKRKEWFTLLCDTDYEFAFKLLNKSKEHLRDIQGHYKKLKGQQTHLAAQTENLDLDTDKLKEEIDKIDAMITSIKLEIQDINSRISNVKGQEELGVEEHRQLQFKIIKEMGKLNALDITLKDEPTLKERLQTLDTEVTVLTQERNRMIQVIDEKQQKIYELTHYSSEDINKLKQNKDEYVQRLNKLKALQTIDIKCSIHEIQMVRDHKADIEASIELVRTNPTLQYDKESVQKLEEVIRQDKMSLSDINLRRTRADTYVKVTSEREKEAKAKCPNCQHEFHPGVNVEVYEKARKAVEAYDAETKTLTDRIDENVAKLQHIYTFQGMIKEVIENIRSNPNALNAFSPILKAHLPMENRQSLMTEWTRYFYQLERVEEIIQLEKKVSDIDQILHQHKQGDEQYIQHLKGEIDKQTTQLNGLEDKYRSLVMEQKEVKNILVTISTFTQLTDEFIDQKQRRDSGFVCKVLEGKKSALEELLKENVNQLAHYNNLYIDRLHLKNKLSEMDKEIETCEKDMTMYKHIVDSLSPDTGLIAQGLIGYIKRYLVNMETFISNVWSYPIYLYPSKNTEGNDLNYRFPFSLDRSDTIRQDVSMGSDGIREIVDLAFKVVAMHTLSLTDYPLFLDEFGRTFDARHREKGVLLIEKLVTQKTFSQIFMVSHSFMEYSILNNVDFCVLSEDNVVLPEGEYNLNTEIERN